MLHIVVGSLAIIIGVWGVMRNWYMFLDLAGVLVPLAILAFGVVALLAGIRTLKNDK
jgi:hypothetical protein